jgi:hypothetical protein
MFPANESRLIYGYVGKARNLKQYLQKPLTVTEQACGYRQPDFIGLRTSSESFEIPARLLQTVLN